MFRVRHCGIRRGVVLSSLARQGISWRGKVLRGRALYGEALHSKVWQGFILAWLSFVRSCSAGRATVERGFVLHGEVSLWFGEVLLCIVGFIGVLYSLVRSYCGLVWHREARHVMVKFGPVMYSMALYAKAFLRRGIVRCRTVGSGFARLRAVGQALVSLRFGRALLSKVLRGPVLRGPVRLGVHGYGGITK